MLVTGANKNVYVSGTTDSDGDLEISMHADCGSEEATSWLNRQDAYNLIKHLQDAFDITLDEL